MVEKIPIKTSTLKYQNFAKQNPCRVLYLPELDIIASACYTYDPAKISRSGSLELFNTYFLLLR